MAWMLINPQIHNIFASLGVRQGDRYKVNDECLPILNEILNNLVIEDRTLRTFRRAIGFGQYIRKDLLPLLIHVKDDTRIKDSSKIIDVTIKILVNLTIPVECLISTEALSRTSIGRHTIFEINKMLLSSKEAFVDTKSTKAVLEHMLYVVEQGYCSKLEVEQCDSINNCLLLLRNILHIPEHRNHVSNCPLAHSSMQNQILWNLFTQSIDKILIHLMSCPQKIYWVVSMVQLIALMYKDQHVGTLQKLLNIWFEASLSDSSDDNESNTSPPNQNSGDSSPMLTSDPTSDSSDGGGNGTNNRSTSEPSLPKQHVVRSQQNRHKVILTSHKHSSHNNKVSDLDSSISSGDSKSGSSTQNGSNGNYSNSKKQVDLNSSEFSDYGYGTQLENQGSISASTSSNDDEPKKKPIHQKPHSKMRIVKQNKSPQEKKEERRQKLIKRSKTNMINMKGLLHHSPTDDNISNILKEFTVDFLLKGYGSVVNDLYTQLLSNYHIQIDTSHFFWLVTYFLKFAAQLELNYEHIAPVISINIISYLTYEGISLCEQLGVNKNRPVDVDIKPCLRRMHLVVTAIKEYLQAVNTYKNLNHLSPGDQDNIIKLQLQIASMENFKSLFLLLIRQYNTSLQSKQYLQDLITTNHIFLLFLDDVSKLPQYEYEKDKMREHLKQFATVEVVHKYGILLEEFETNGQYVNDCIFTMLHHIGGDLDNIAALFQPRILKTFSKIWESDYEVCDDWSDLIEYVIHKFINVPKNNDCSAPTSNQPSEAMPLVYSVQELTQPSTSNFHDRWPQEDLDSLYWFYIESQKTTNMIDNIIRHYEENGSANKSKLGVIQQLRKQNFISQTTYEELMRSEKLSDSGIIDCESETSGDCEDIKILKETLLKDNLGTSILWLQKVLMEACYSRVYIANRDIFKGSSEVVEPVPYCYSMLNQSIPLVPWNDEQWSLLSVPPFVLLLHKLGFLLPNENGKLFARIPHFWTAKYMFKVAQTLGPVDIGVLKFDVNLLSVADKPVLALRDTRPQNTMQVLQRCIADYAPIGDPVPNWYDTVLQSKSTNIIEATNDTDVPSSMDIPLENPIPLMEMPSNEILQSSIPFVSVTDVQKLGVKLENERSDSDMLTVDSCQRSDSEVETNERSDAKMSTVSTTNVNSLIRKVLRNGHGDAGEQPSEMEDTSSVASNIVKMNVSDKDDI